MLREKHHTHVSSYGLPVWLLGVAVWLTWAPFVRRDGAPEARLFFPSDPGDLFVNLLMLAPLAVVIALRSGGMGRTGHPRAAIAVTAAIAIVLEAGQWSVFGRVVSPWDPLLNVAGAAAAAALAIYMAKRGVKASALVATVTLTIFIATAGFLVKSAAKVKSEFRLRGWRPDYHIVAGDEFGGERPYRGQIDSALVCAGAELSTVCATADADTQSRQRLVAEAERSQMIRLSALVLPLDDRMSGHARIITFSVSPVNRNATLAQRGRDLVFRVRTPMTGDNGSRPQFILPGAVAETETFVSGEFADGTARLSARAGERTLSTTFRFGLLDSWLMDNWLVVSELRDLTPGPPRRAAIAGAFVLLLPLGLVLGWKRPGFRTLSFVLVALVGSLFALEHLWLGMPFRFFQHLALPALSCLAGGWLGWRDRCASATRSIH